MNTKLILLSFLLSIPIFSQHEADNWIFGVNAGVNFQSGNPTNISSSLIPMSSMEGCAAISDVSGNLLFYVGAPHENASNLTVWIPYDSDNNGVHDIMPGGNNLIGDVSATQAAIIVPKPDDDTIYYIFTVDKFDGYTPENNRGLNYYTVDMTLNSGKGGISGGVVNLLQYSAEKITAVKSNDCKSIWVISYSSNDTHGSNVASNAFHAFKVTNTGVDPNSVITNSGLSGMVDGRGYMKISPNGKKLAMAQTPNQEVLLFDFDGVTGVVSNGIQLHFPKYDDTYGLEFSKESKRLYVTTYDNHGDDTNLPNDGFLYQFDLEAAQPENSAVVIDAVYDNLYRTALQLAPDGKIYRTMPRFWGVTGGAQFLSVINSPENVGPSCNYTTNVVDLDVGRSHQGLPPFIQSLFTDNLDIIHQVNLNTNELNLCIGDTFTIYADDTNYPAGTTYSWTLNGNPIAETSNSITLDYTGTYSIGLFEVTVTFPDSNCPQKGSAKVSFFTRPTANQVNDWMVCDTDNDGFFNFDLASLNPTVLGAQSATDFSVSYHLSQDHANADTNPIALNYTNLTANLAQTIYIRVENNACSTCFDTTDFTIDVFDTPTANTVPNIESCDNAIDGDDTNGLLSFDLTIQDAGILGTQSASQNYITYHLSQNDADQDFNPIGSPYQNTKNHQDIFVRVENVDHPECFDTTSFSLEVLPLPVITATPVSLEQCDDDLDGYTPFNLFESAQLISTDYQHETFTYYLSQQDALNHINPITNPTNYTNPNQPTSKVWVEVSTIHGCTRVKEVSLTVATTQIPSNFLIQYGDCDNLLIDNNDTNGVIPFDLSDANAQIEALFPNPQNLKITYYEKMEDALMEQNAISDLSNYQNINSPYHQFITVRVDSEDYNACLGLGDHIELNVYPLPVMPIILDTQETYCLYEGSIYLEPTTAGAPYTYEWTLGGTVVGNNAILEVNAVGTYTLRVSTAEGCSVSQNVVVEESQESLLTEEDLVFTQFENNNTLTIPTGTVYGLGNYLYSIDGSPFTSQVQYSNLSGGTHTLDISDQNGCKTHTINFFILDYMHFFTPNGDGHNDTWNLLGGSTQPDAEIYIYDRFGKLLAKIDPMGIGWDGTYNGQPLPSTDYWFSIKLSDGSIKKGHFSLVRR